MSKNFCIYCGASLVEGSDFCNICGKKIAKFEKHTAVKEWESTSYSVYYENVPYQRLILNKAEFDLAQCIDEFIRRGIDPKDIRRILDLAGNVAVAAALEGPR